MTNVPTSRKLGIAARIAGQQVRRTRTYGAVSSAARAATGRMLAVLHQLWLEITGFVFLAFAAGGWFAVIKEYTASHSGKGSSRDLAITFAFSLVFSWFAISSFGKARNRR